jgi:hypothetical protein
MHNIRPQPKIEAVPTYLRSAMAVYWEVLEKLARYKLYVTRPHILEVFLLPDK